MNVANSNMPTTATAKTGSAEKAQVVVLEKRLKEAMDQKETTEVSPAVTTSDTPVVHLFCM